MKTITTIKTWSLILVLTGLTLAACAHSSGGRAYTTGGAPGGGLWEGVVGVYRGPLNHLKAVRRGDGCPMHPTCSQYSQEAVARFGFATGWMMTMDRLMRCGRDETRLAPRILVNGKLKYHDPVDNNHFGQPTARR
ncbi:MAG: membrane protein insertion efficiency factor YidD [Desulfosarcina sp.]